MMHATVLHCIF